MKMYALNVLFSISFLSITSAYGQDTSTADKVVQESSKPYEIVVTPTISRMSLRSLIVQVEEDFFAKFNELNIDDDYDIVCYRFLPTMSHIPKRVCEPNFYIMTRSENSAEYLAAYGACKTCVNAPPILMSRKGLRNETGKRFETLQEKMEELNATDAEFNSIGSVLAKLKSRLKTFGDE